MPLVGQCAEGEEFLQNKVATRVLDRGPFTSSNVPLACPRSRFLPGPNFGKHRCGQAPRDSLRTVTGKTVRLRAEV
ncbi:MAG TPA: hypothetical protein DDY91_08965 [Planctomycetaceae bacterium]|nr:hypothetical protein [Planctomycetaceae bacterium]